MIRNTYSWSLGSPRRSIAKTGSTPNKSPGLSRRSLWAKADHFGPSIPRRRSEWPILTRDFPPVGILCLDAQHSRTSCDLADFPHVAISAFSFFRDVSRFSTLVYDLLPYFFREGGAEEGALHAPCRFQLCDLSASVVKSYLRLVEIRVHPRSSTVQLFSVVSVLQTFKIRRVLRRFSREVGIWHLAFGHSRRVSFSRSLVAASAALHLGGELTPNPHNSGSFELRSTFILAAFTDSQPST